MAGKIIKNEKYPKHLIPDSISFSVFTAEQIKKLSVTKICTPLTLDNLGHPLPGGLYDKHLGPLSDKSDPCGTCHKNIYGCPGHFGYIELPLPLINPIFHKIVGIILKMSCLTCFRIQIPSHIKISLNVQIKLLNCGLTTEALEVQKIISQLVSTYESLENVPKDCTAQLDKYQEIADHASKNLQGKFTLNKNTETLRNNFINDMLKEVKPRRTCLFCKQALSRMTVLKSKIILHQKLEQEEAAVAASARGRSKTVESKFITPEESRKLMRNIWKEEKDLIILIASVLNDIDIEFPTDAFYFEVIPVTPPNVRPVNIIANMVSDHPQTKSYKSILHNSILLRAIIQVVQNKGEINSLPVEAKGAYSLAEGNSPVEKLNYAWEALQKDVNILVDSDTGLNSDNYIGLKQIIEKKQGIIRKYMMGKRVNFAARSVITPDPNLNIDEIGIPETFAKHLTYPVAVTSWNVEELRKMIMNGPNVHPGAVLIEFEDGSISRINSSDTTQKNSLLKRLLTPDDKEKLFEGVKTVHRHLCNGDILLLNRQPTLHKPSIMAHKARILKGEKTLRLHYANCKAYNADFDGDEMNAHFPQNELARSEGYNIANVCNQYLVPKDGTPLSGLIQDHMISGVRLTLRGKFFNRNDYQQLVFQGLSFMTGEIKLLPPSIIKPMNLWSGKQILSTIIMNITPKGFAHINLTHVSKIPAEAWQCEKRRKWKAGGTPFTKPNTMSEGEVIIRGGELLVGVLDKTHYGATPYGLIHCFYELYGGLYATRLLSSLAKLFTRFLQQEGFTLGVHDILVLDKADKKRSEIINNLREIGKKTITSAMGLPENAELDEVVKKIEKESETNPKVRSIIDRQYKSALDSYTNDINKTCLPAGLVCKFPQNNLQLMVQSGAKGSTVNTMQISCLLGQIELEGKRPPVMICGKSLPSFPVSDFSPRAGGFIDGRFMTGIQPQEFFFHCMAGREGLIDTAVKTSRSGYLQRCLIKHLEGLTIGYDMTVRDSDRSVIQFLYGEDGMDVSKVQFLNPKQMQFLSENTKAMVDKKIVKQLKKDENQTQLKHLTKELNTWIEKHGDPLNRKKVNPFVLFSRVIKRKVGDNPNIDSKKIAEMWHQSDEQFKGSFGTHCDPCPDTLNSVFQPDSNFGSINERLQNIMNSFEGSLSSKKQKKSFQNMLKLKSMQSLCAAGEPVGLLAAQSIGEPSTQMTLNTFHFAGRGEMNVTLGIPRLREILMMASKNIKTPSMEIPFLDVPNLEKKAEKLRKKFTRVVVANVLEKVDVTVQMELQPRQHTYVLRFHFLPHKLYKSEYHVKAENILKHMSNKFFGEMFVAIRKYTKMNANIILLEEENKAKRRNNGENSDDDEAEPPQQYGNDNDSSDEEPEDEEDAKMNTKFNNIRDDQEPEAEEKEVSDDEMEENEDTVNENTEIGEESSVVDKHYYAKKYTFDKAKSSWCEIVIALPLNIKKLDLTSILKEVTNKSVIWEVPQIKRAITYKKDDKLFIRTDGINIVEMFKHHKLLDLNQLYCNDIHRVADTYGIEAARKILVKEVKDVFNVYGIKVDPRHLLLIADYMTFSGTYEPLSRKGMDSGASPLQQMSFESSLTFLKAAVIRGKQDSLTNPSSCLMVGKACESGTGCFSLYQNIQKNFK